MKRIKLSTKKLKLAKEKITSLSNDEANRILGGTATTSSQRCIATANSSACPPPTPPKSYYTYTSGHSCAM